MRSVRYAMSVSLDGLIQSKKGDISWAAPDEELHRHFNVLEASTDINLYGRKMYEGMSAFWPTADASPSASPAEKEYAEIWRNKPKIVFSRSLKEARWNTRIVRDDISGVVNRLKEEEGNCLSVSGAEIAATFTRLSLIDEYWLYIIPVLLGGGKPMFLPGQGSIPLKLLETRTFGSGVLLLKYLRQPA